MEVVRGAGVTFTVKQRGKLTYYSQGERPVLSSLMIRGALTGTAKA
jgi:hypothetical protein